VRERAREKERELARIDRFSAPKRAAHNNERLDHYCDMAHGRRDLYILQLEESNFLQLEESNRTNGHGSRTYGKSASNDERRSRTGPKPETLNAKPETLNPKY
jgi:hypothetical protein